MRHLYLLELKFCTFYDLVLLTKLSAQMSKFSNEIFMKSFCEIVDHKNIMKIIFFLVEFVVPKLLFRLGPESGCYRC